MNVLMAKNYDELSTVIASTLLSTMYMDQQRINICVTTGTTPIKAYRILAPLVKNKSYFQHIHYYVVDEFWYQGNRQKKEEAVPVNKSSMDAKFFEEAEIPADHIHTLTDENVDNFDKQLQQDGGLDLVIMGVGNDGHFCGNHPGTFLQWGEESHKVDRYQTPYVTELLVRLLHEDIHSEDESRIPDHYLTMGPKTIWNARKIAIIMNGHEKCKTVKKAFFHPITIDFPVSIFQLHPHVTLLLDEVAAKEIITLLPKGREC